MERLQGEALVGWPSDERHVSPVTVVLLALLIPMAGIAVMNLLFAPRLHRLEPAATGPFVSVLVPARDEAANLRRLLPALSDTRYRDFEVIVLDDGSRDETGAVARGHAASDDRFQAVVGVDPPPGWIGKAWACHQLARQARGSLMIFVDADVAPGPDAIGRTVAALERTDAHVVTGLPRHEPGGWFEEAVIPIVAKLPIAALLPLPLVRHTRKPSLAVGNGQWLAWRREAYDHVGGHARVRDEVLEDVALARAAKADGLRVAPFIATRDLTVRMYAGPGQAWEGLGKNVYRLAGGRDWLAGSVLVLFLAAMLAPIGLPMFVHGGTAWAPLGAMIVVRAAGALLFRETIASLALHPIGVVAAAALLVSSRSRVRKGRVVWKGRTLPARTA